VHGHDRRAHATAGAEAKIDAGGGLAALEGGAQPQRSADGGAVDVKARVEAPLKRDPRRNKLPKAPQVDVAQAHPRVVEAVKPALRPREVARRPKPGLDVDACDALGRGGSAGRLYAELNTHRADPGPRGVAVEGERRLEVVHPSDAAVVPRERSAARRRAPRIESDPPRNLSAHPRGPQERAQPEQVEGLQLGVEGAALQAEGETAVRRGRDAQLGGDIAQGVGPVGAARHVHPTFEAGLRTAEHELSLRHVHAEPRRVAQVDRGPEPHRRRAAACAAWQGRKLRAQSITRDVKLRLERAPRVAGDGGVGIEGAEGAHGEPAHPRRHVEVFEGVFVAHPRGDGARPHAEPRHLEARHGRARLGADAAVEGVSAGVQPDAAVQPTAHPGNVHKVGGVEVDLGVEGGGAVGAVVGATRGEVELGHLEAVETNTLSLDVGLGAERWQWHAEHVALDARGVEHEPVGRAVLPAVEGEYALQVTRGQPRCDALKPQVVHGQFDALVPASEGGVQVGALSVDGQGGGELPLAVEGALGVGAFEMNLRGQRGIGGPSQRAVESAFGHEAVVEGGGDVPLAVAPCVHGAAQGVARDGEVGLDAAGRQRGQAAIEGDAVRADGGVRNDATEGVDVGGEPAGRVGGAAVEVKVAGLAGESLQGAVDAVNLHDEGRGDHREVGRRGLRGVGVDGVGRGQGGHAGPGLGDVEVQLRQRRGAGEGGHDAPGVAEVEGGLRDHRVAAEVAPGEARQSDVPGGKHLDGAEACGARHPGGEALPGEVAQREATDAAGQVQYEREHTQRERADEAQRRREHEAGSVCGAGAHQ